MADKTANANHSARTAATESDINGWKPIMLLQVSMLRMWAHSIERFAGNYERALDETREERSDRERAA